MVKNPNSNSQPTFFLGVSWITNDHGGPNNVNDLSSSPKLLKSSFALEPPQEVDIRQNRFLVDWRPPWWKFLLNFTLFEQIRVATLVSLTASQPAASQSASSQQSASQAASQPARPASSQPASLFLHVLMQYSFKICLCLQKHSNLVVKNETKSL